MAELFFNVHSNWQEVEKLRNECSRLEAQLRATNAQTDPKYQKQLEDQLKSTRQRMDEMVGTAARAGAVMSKDFSRKIADMEMSTKRLKQAIDVTKQQYRELASMRGALEGKRRSTAKGSSEYRSLTRDINDLTATMTELQTRRNELDKQHKHSENVLKGLNEQRTLYASGLVKSGSAAKEATTALGSMSRSSAKASTAMADLGVTAGQKLPSAFGLFNNSVGMLNENLVTLSAGLLGGFGFAQFMNTIIHTRGQFQQTEMAFETMLGSAEKASALTNQLIDTAAKTPFDFGQVTGAAKQLLAYGTAANEVNDILKRLGDISAGVGSSMGELAYLYGTTMTQGRMYTMDLRQFMGRGIPMAEALAKVMDTTTAKVGKLVTDGKVGAEQVKAAIIEMTKEGSKFGGMMERQSASFTGRLSNIEDAISQMFNELGKRLEPTIGKGLELTGAMVENWETIGKFILTACAALGTYKAGLLATAAIRNVQEKSALTATNTEFNNQIKELERMKRDAQNTFASMRGGKDAYKEETMAGINESLMDTTQDDTMLKARLEIARQNGIINEELEKEILNKRQLIELATEETRLAQLNVERQTRANLDEELTAAEEKLSSVQNELDKAIEKRDATLSELDKSERRAQDIQDTLASADAKTKEAKATELQMEKEKQEALQQQLATDELEVNTAQQNVNTAATERDTIQTKLNTTNKNINTLSTKGNTIAATTNAGATNTMTFAQRLHTVAARAGAATERLLTAAVNESTRALTAMKAALMTNPITAIATVAMTAVTAFSMFNDELDETAEISKKFGDAANSVTIKVDGLLAVLNNAPEKSDAVAKAAKELAQIYTEYGIKVDEEGKNIDELRNKHESLTEAIKAESVARIQANAIQTEIENFNKEFEEAMKKMVEGIDKEKQNMVSAAIQSIFPKDELLRMWETEKRLAETYKNKEKDLESYKKAQAEYTAMLTSNNAKLSDLGKTMGLSSNQAANLQNQIRFLYESVGKSSDKMHEHIGTINNVAAGYVNWNDKVQQNNNTLKVAKMKVEDVRAETDKLIKEFNTTCHMNLKMHYDDTEIPKWIKNMSDADLANFIGRRNTAMNLINKGSKGVKIGGRYKTGTEVGTELAMATSLQEQRKAAKEKKERDEANQKNKNKTNSFDPEKAKSDVEKAKERIKEINKKAQEDIDKAQIDNLEDGKEKELAKMEQTNKEKLDAIKKQKKQMVDAWVSLAKAEYYQQHKNTKGFNEAATRGKIEENWKTDPKYKEQRDILSRQEEEENKRYQRELAEYEKKEIEKYYQYLKEFGTQRQKQSATIQDYDTKIAKAEGYDKKILKAQKAREMESVKIEGIKQSIDWELVFGEVADLMKDELGQTYKDLREYTRSDDFKKNTSAEDKRTVYDALDRLSAYDPDNKASLDFAQYKKDFEDLGAKIREANRLQGEENAAWLDVEKAQRKYNEAIASGDEKQKASAELELDLARSNAEKASELYTTAQDAVNEASDNLKRKTEKTVDALNDLSSGLSGLKSGSLQGAWNGLENIQKGLESGVLGKLGEKAADKLAGAFQNTKIIGAVLGILDILKEGIGTLISGLIDTIFNAVNGILDNILSGKFITQIGGSLINGIGSVLNTVTFGGFNSLFGIGGSNADKVAETTERLTETNEMLANAVSKLTDEIQNSYGADAADKEAEAKELLSQQIQNQRDILNAQMGEWGKHHSNWYYFENAMREDILSGIFGDGSGNNWYKEIQKTLQVYWTETGEEFRDIASGADILNLSPEELDYLRTNNITAWQQIINAGYYDKSEYWDALADFAGQMDEISETAMKQIIGTSFSDMENSFFSSLMNMEADAEDWADDISKIMAEALIKNNIFDQEYKDKMNEWLKKYRAAMDKYNDKKDKTDADRKALEDELEALRKEQENYMNEKKEEAQMYMDAVGYDPTKTEEQSATARGASSITYDQANNLEGIATAQQITSEQTKNEVTMLNAKVDTLVPVWTDTRNIVADSRDILARMAMDVADIKDNVADSLVPTLKAMRDDLNKIRKKVDMN